MVRTIHLGHPRPGVLHPGGGQHRGAQRYHSGDLFNIQSRNDDHTPSIAISAASLCAGIADPAERRAAFAEAIGYDPHVIRWVAQAHSKRVVQVESAASNGAIADGLVSTHRETVMSVTVADCLPIFIYLRGRPGAGVVHSGWRGTGIVLEAISQLSVLSGVEPNGICAVIGPGIGVCCYDVPEARCREFPDDVSQYRRGKWYLDLRAANVILLEKAGVQDIRIVAECTRCDPRLGSFRREGPDSFSRMVAAIGYF